MDEEHLKTNKETQELLLKSLQDSSKIPSSLAKSTRVSNEVKQLINSFQPLKDKINDKVTECLNSSDKLHNNSLQWTSNLHNAASLSRLIKPVPLETTQKEVQEIKDLFKQQPVAVNASKENRLEGKKLPLKIATNMHKTRPYVRKPMYLNTAKQEPSTVTAVSAMETNECEKSGLNAACEGFKTAKEILQLETGKKLGTTGNTISRTTSNNNSGCSSAVQGLFNAPKRKKFVSPLLTNQNRSTGSSDSLEGIKAAEEVDERLKNIEPKMVELIRNEIMNCGSTIEWDDIAGLEGAKTAIQESVVWPMLRPDIFKGLRRPPKGILLFGPPGTGKTLIGKCVASQSKATFFSISASSLTSKWMGEGEKMVRALFAVARCHQPAVVFIDEVDSLLCQRSESEQEGSRRIKTEFLVQLDGVTTESDERLLIIGATNRPQELDEAARRRFVKRLYIPLPESEARRQLVSNLMSKEKHLLSGEDIKAIGEKSQGYSGADIKNLCTDACLGPIRSLNFSQMQTMDAADVRPVDMSDFNNAFLRVKSSVSPDDLDRYIKWDDTYGSGGFQR